MLIADFFSWWYTSGWSWAAKHLFLQQNKSILQFFSVSEMIKTLFAPFRQDAVDTRRAPIDVKLQVLGGNIISRCFGFIIRSLLIIVGLLATAMNCLLAFATVCLWPLMPIAPVVAFTLMVLRVGA